jgi:flagellar hook-length control protein FliK
MLQSVNIPSSPLPEVPSAPPGPPGDAGERAEFSHLLQQARAAEPEGAHDAPTALSAKDARRDLRAHTGSSRATQEHKPHDLRHRADAESKDADGEAIDLAGSMLQRPLTDAASAPNDEATPAQAKDEHDTGPVPAVPDPVLPVALHASEPLPAGPQPETDPIAGDEHAVRTPQRGARELRLPVRSEPSATPAAESGAAAAGPQANDIALPGAKDGAFDLMLRQTAGSRGTAPSLHGGTLEAAAAATPAFAREAQQALATHTDARAEALLRAAPDEAGFAPALGTQVALWVKDGVQEARLQLHPAELGPVTVQIALDGQAAHIDFTAAVAATRESIEQSLPALAAALRESGFTLAGGGVFGRSGQGTNDAQRERTPEGRGQRGTAAVGGTAGTETAPHLPRRWARSLVDVYA